ncbi:Bud-site selection protein, partial [Microdochium bolleyi]
MAQKRKRPSEPSLRDKLVGWNKALVRAFKTAKGFERQRLSKRIREVQGAAAADAAAKAERLEREVAVLKSIDLHQLAHQHLSSSLLRVKGVAEAKGLPEEIKLIPKPEGLSEEERTALHNVTSGLCNRKQVRDVVEEAVMGTCIALRVAMPDKNKKKQKKGGKEGADAAKESDKPAEEGDERAAKKSKTEAAGHTEAAESKQQKKPKETDALVLLKRKQDKLDKKGNAGASGSEEEDEEEDDDEEAPFEGFSDIDAEERAFAKYDALVAGSSDEDGVDLPSNSEDEEDSADDNDDDGGDDSLDERMLARYDKLVAASSDSDSDGEARGLGSDDEDELLGSRARAIRRTTADDISLSSGDEAGDRLPPGGDDLNREFSGAESSDEAEYDVDNGSDSEEGQENSEEEGEDGEESGSNSGSGSDAAPAPKRAKTAKIKTNTGTSAFLPTLMGGYISNSESEASDIDVAPSLKKNRRGQRARQQIWEKKYGDKARHFSKPQTSQNARDLGWDPRRGAVGDGGAGDGGAAAGPWKQGIRNPFEKRAKDEGIHPERQRAIERGGNENFGGREKGSRQQPTHGGGSGEGPSRERGFAGRGGAAGGAGGGRGHGNGGSGRGGSFRGGSSRGGADAGAGGRGGSGHGFSAPMAAKPPPPPTKRDDTGPLHPSWAAAKKAKDEAGKIAFQGKKVVF